MQQKTFGALLLLLASADGLSAQTSRSDPVDMQARLGMQLKLNLPRKWDASVGYEARMTGNASQYRGSYIDGELGRAAGKWLTVFTNYRFASVTNDESHRFGVGGEVEKKMDRFSLSLRPQFQYQLSALEDGDQVASRTIRTRLRAKVPAGKRLTFYGSAEPFFALGDTYYPIDNWRNAIGVQWEFMKKSKVDAYYIYRPDYAKELYNRTFHILGVEISREMKFPN
jgi:hypothetical protein